jgi:single-strand DNA-binding protein
MGISNLNVVAISGNLTRDPELRSLPSGNSVCKMRVAVNSRRKQGNEWVDKPNFFDVTVWGAQGENCATYLSKGRGVVVDGRLDWREWEAQDGSKRQAVEIIANNVQFLGEAKQTQPTSDVPYDDAGQEPEPQPAATTAGPGPSAPDDDPIPF